MSNTINERVLTIKEEHLELLKMAREKIMANKDNFDNCANEVIPVLEYDNENIKKYEAMVNAQELVVNLTKQILDAKDVEEMVAIRKKINYYINKIKGELKKREVSQEITDTYQGEVTSLRKSISGYIRFFKREDNICEIERLSNNYENLSLEEMDNLKKCLKRENNYNKRNIKAFKDEEIIKQEEVKEENKPIYKLIGDVYYEIENNTSNSNIPTSMDIEEENIKSEVSLIQERTLKMNAKDLTYEETNDYFNECINNFVSQYDVKETINYQKNNVGKNILTFFQNIPKYIHNKKAIQNMKKDYYLFYRGSDLKSFMVYMRKRNSIQNGLKCIFSNSHLFSNDIAYLNEHENCAKWMHDYCVQKSLPIWVKQRVY